MGLPHNGSSDEFLEEPAKSRVGTFWRNLPPSRHLMREAVARGKSLQGSGHIVRSVLNAPTVRAVLGDGAFGVFALNSLFVEWLHLETVKPLESAKELTKNPEESIEYRSCVVHDSSLGIAFRADAASPLSVEKTPSAAEVMVFDEGQAVVNEVNDGSAGSNSRETMVTEIATFGAALSKQTWLRQRSVFDLDALHQDLSLLRFAKDKGILEKDAHDDILINLLGVQPPRGNASDEMDQERRLDRHRKKARRLSSELLLDCQVLRDFPTIFLLDSREISLRWWRNSTLIHSYRVVLKHFIAVLEGWPAILGWKDDLLALLQAR